MTATWSRSYMTLGTTDMRSDLFSTEAKCRAAGALLHLPYAIPGDVRTETYEKYDCVKVDVQ